MFLKFSLILSLIFILLYSGCERLTSSIDIDDGLPPTTPSNVYIYSARDGRIIIEWNNNTESDFSKYTIYRSINDTLNFKVHYSTTDNYFVDDSLEYENTYYYRISAMDINERESTKSWVVYAKPINRSAPAKPRNIEINARNWNDSISIYLSWDPNTEGDLFGYKIYREERENFNIDSSNYLGFSVTNNFTDTKELQLYKNYFYKIVAVDKGWLQSEPGNEVTDLIFEVPEIIYPSDDIRIEYFNNFLLKAVKHPALYKIILQENQFFGEVWSKDFSTQVTDDTIAISFDAGYIYSNRTYYWRVATYSGFSSNPNSISKLYSFVIKP